MSQTISVDVVPGHIAVEWQMGPWAASAEKGWDSWQADHRQTLAVAVKVLNAKSVYEIGCGSGPNLRLLREALPGVRLGGCDVRAEYALWARQHGLGVECRTLPAEVGAEWDAVLSCYVMAYLSVDEVREQLGSLKPRGLILMEPEGYIAEQATATQFDDDAISCPHYWHDWGALLAEAGYHIPWRWPIAQINGLESLMVAVRG